MRTHLTATVALVTSLCAGLAASQSLAASLADRLERPARPSPLASLALLTDLQVVGAQVVVVGANGHVLLADTDGRLQQAQVPVDLLLTAVHFVDPSRGWAVGHDGVILHSQDGGLSWSKQLDGNTINQLMTTWAEAEVSRLEAASAAAPDDEALSSALDNALFALDDVKAGSEPGPSRPLLDIWFRDAQRGWAVGAYGIVLHTDDGGQTWKYLASLDNPDRLHLNTVLGLGDGSLLVAGEGGRLYRSEDDGASWGPIQTQTEASLYKLLDWQQGQRVLALGFGGTLLSSADSGRNWQSLSLPDKASLYGGSELTNGSLLLAGQGGVLLYSQDGQNFNTWQGPSKSAWMNVAEVVPGQLALVGRDGLHKLPLAEITERLQ